MPRLPLPPPRTLPWSLRPQTSALTGLHYDRFGRMVLTIEHQHLEGLTPAMLAWWFRNIGGEVEIGGRRMTRYHAWHPSDHILWELVGGQAGTRVGVGSRFRIVEAFAANPKYYVDVIETVTRLDEAGITLVGRWGGIAITCLSHDFTAADGGTLYRSMLRVGIGLPLISRPTNWLLHRFFFSEAMGRAWLKHNIEGLLEHLLPLLGYRDATGG